MLTTTFTNIFIKDLDGKEGKFPIFKLIFYFIYKFFICLTFLLISSSLPLVSLIIIIASTIYFLIRRGLEIIIFKLFLPYFIEKSIIKSNASRKLLSKKQALLILISKLEQRKLENYYKNIISKLNEPILVYEEFFRNNLSAFSCVLDENQDGFYRELLRETMGYKARLDEIVLKMPRVLFKSSFVGCGEIDAFIAEGVGLLDNNVVAFVQTVYQLFGEQFFVEHVDNRVGFQGGEHVRYLLFFN